MQNLKQMFQSAVLTADVKYSSRKIALKTARDGEKTWHMTQFITFSSNFYWNICFKFCILEQIIATVLFLCISSINNKRSSLRFQSTMAPTNRGWSACGLTRLLCDTWPACMRKDESILYDDEMRWKILHLSLFTMNALGIADPRSLFMCHINLNWFCPLWASLQLDTVPLTGCFRGHRSKSW